MSRPGLQAKVARLAPELRLLLALALGSGAPGRAVGSGAIRWPAFLALAQRHGVAGLVAPALDRAGLAPPEPVRGRLWALAREVAASGLRHAAELTRLAAVFAREGVDLLPIKGPELAQRLFGNPGAREVTDLDLLVRPGDLARAEALMAREGYRCIDPGFTPGPRLRAALLAWRYHFHYRHPQSGLDVEIHWRFDFWAPPKIDALWRRRIRRPWADGTLAALDDDGLLLFLCYHGARHTWSRAKWLADIAALLARPRQAPWQDLFDLAAELGQEEPLAQAAALVAALGGPPLPGPLERFVAARRLPAGILGHALDRLARGAGRESLPRVVASILPRFRYVRRLNRAVPLGELLATLAFRPEHTGPLGLPERCFGLHFLLGPPLWILGKVRGRPAPDGTPAGRRSGQQQAQPGGPDHRAQDQA